MEVREDLWPVLYIRLRGRMREEEWLEVFRAFSRFYARGARYCSIIDSSAITALPSATSRSLIAQLAKEHEPESRRWILESNVVIDNALARGALTAIQWLAPPVYPLYYVATRQEAFARAFAALARDNRPVSEDIRAQAARLRA
jgi:hypothetical protein